MARLTKTQQAKELFLAGKYRESMRIVKTFRAISPEDKKNIQYGYDVMTHPDFYLQLGRDVKAIEKAAMDSLNKFFQWVQK